MRNTAIAIITAVAVLASAPGEAAQKSQKNENIGVGTGAIIGAAAWALEVGIRAAEALVEIFVVRRADTPITLAVSRQAQIEGDAHW